MIWILLVTWVTPGLPPTTSQTQFGSQQACIAARDEVLRSAQAKQQKMLAAAGNDKALQILATQNFPHVSAVCSQQ